MKINLTLREMLFLAIAAASGLFAFMLLAASTKSEIQRQTLKSEISSLQSQMAILEKEKEDLTRRLIVSRGLPGFAQNEEAER